MLNEKESCPLCGALPCDWVNDPHQARDILIMTLAEIRRVTGVGERPMLSELPEAIVAAMADPSAISGVEVHLWRHTVTGALSIRSHACMTGAHASELVTLPYRFPAPPAPRVASSPQTADAEPGMPQNPFPTIQQGGGDG